MSAQFLDLLYEEAPREAFDAVVTDAIAAGVAGHELEQLRRHRTIALRIREQIERRRQREAEMSALYETANDLTAIRDVDTILAAIARRARSLLHADMTYLSLNDESGRASYMKVTEGALTPEFRRLRLPLGTGLLGLVAQTGEPYYTEDYHSDPRFLHQEFIDTAVEGEQIRAILGVPLTVEGKVIGALLAVHRTVRPFPPGEVSLLMSFAAHAAVALENAQLFEQLDRANRQVRAQAHAVEVAATAHDRLTDVLLHGGGVAAVAAVLAEVLEGTVLVLDDKGTVDPLVRLVLLQMALKSAIFRLMVVSGTPRKLCAPQPTSCPPRPLAKGRPWLPVGPSHRPSIFRKYSAGYTGYTRIMKGPKSDPPGHDGPTDHGENR